MKSWNYCFKAFLLAVFFLFSEISGSQNKTEEQIAAEGIAEINVDGDQIFNITVNTVQTDKIRVSSLSDGEYGNEFQVISEVKANRLTLSLKRTVPYDIPDDKRNAHKVVAAHLEITMPQNLSLFIKSDIGSVVANGIFRELKINLTQGGCTIDAIARLATIKTIDGHINAKTENALISTDSHHGLVDFPSDMIGFNIWKLSTNGGNITVTKRE